tara:strand:- start:10650 stop:10904 length:255 start_codon:yes stop_codon:yes gene_type:complete
VIAVRQHVACLLNSKSFDEAVPSPEVETTGVKPSVLIPEAKIAVLGVKKSRGGYINSDDVVTIRSKGLAVSREETSTAGTTFYG